MINVCDDCFSDLAPTGFCQNCHTLISSDTNHSLGISATHEPSRFLDGQEDRLRNEGKSMMEPQHSHSNSNTRFADGYWTEEGKF